MVARAPTTIPPACLYLSIYLSIVIHISIPSYLSINASSVGVDDKEQHVMVTQLDWINADRLLSFSWLLGVARIHHPLTHDRSIKPAVWLSNYHDATPAIRVVDATTRSTLTTIDLCASVRSYAASRSSFDAHQTTRAARAASARDRARATTSSNRSTNTLSCCPCCCPYHSYHDDNDDDKSATAAATAATSREASRRGIGADRAPTLPSRRRRGSGQRRQELARQ